MSAPLSAQANAPSKATTRPKAMAAALIATLAGSAWVALQPEAPQAEAVPAARGGPPRAAALNAAARGGSAGAPAATASASAAAPVAWPTSALRDPDATHWPPLRDAARAAWSAPAAPAAPLQTGAATAAFAEAPPPRFPFTVVGRWESLAEPASATTAASPSPAPSTPMRSPTSRTLVLLAGPQRSYAVGAGDLVGDQWRIERVAATSFTVTYLPQGKALTVSFKPS